MKDEILAVARLELAEVLRSRWLLFCGAIYGVLAAVFVLVGLRESSVLGFTGMGRVLLSFCHALVLLLPLLALSATGPVVNRARDDGTLELLFSHPVSRDSYFIAVTGVRFLALLLPLWALLLSMALLGQLAFGQPLPWAFLLRTAAVSGALLWAFVGLGLLISCRVRNPGKATMYVLLCWALGVALLDFGLIGLMLQLRLSAPATFLLAALNPVESARLALLAAAEPELATLGPVGFFLSGRVGSGGLLFAGLLWPTLLGMGLWALAARGFRRGDLV